MTRRSRVRRVIAGSSATGLLLLGACGAEEPGGPPSSSAASEPSADTHDVERLRDALSAQGSDVAERLDADSTTVTQVESPFPRWRVLEVEDTSGDHPLSWTFVVNRSGEPRAVNLAADASAWGQLLEGVQLTSSSEAREMATTHLDLTHDAAEGVYAVSTADDIRWLASDSSNAKESVASDRERVRDDVHAPRVTTSSQGWKVTLTAMHQQSLVEHVFTVTRDGAVDETTRTVARDLATRVAH